MQNWRELGLFAELESRRQERPLALHKNSILFTELGTQELSHHQKFKGCNETVTFIFKSYFPCQWRWGKVDQKPFISHSTTDLGQTSHYTSWHVHKTVCSAMTLQQGVKAKDRMSVCPNSSLMLKSKIHLAVSRVGRYCHITTSKH